jgi:hypothetical protein
MSTIQDDVQKLVDRAVVLSIKAPMLTLPQIMRAAKFTNAQSEDRALQMQVCHAKNAPTPHIGSEVYLASPMPTVSTVTNSSSTTETGGTSTTATLVTSEFAPPPLQEATRQTSVAKMKCVNNTKKLKAHEREALKWVMQFGGGGNIGGHSTWQTAGNVGAADLCNRDSNVGRQIQSFSRTSEEEIG